jgi:hypothetical protein
MAEEKSDPALDDLCMNCGKRYPWRLWGAHCPCPAPKVVHVRKCNGCEQLMGQRSSSRRPCPELLFCPTCVRVAVEKAAEKP